MNLIGTIARRFGGGGGGGAVSAPRGVQAGYLRDSSARFLSSWRPALRDGAEDVRASWGGAAARAIDSLHNSGWLAGGIAQASADTVGAGLTLHAQPDGDELGWSEDYRDHWSRQVERRWRRWSNDPAQCDGRGRATVSQIIDTALRWNFAYGESVAILPLIRRQGVAGMTRVMLIPPHRIPLDTQMHERLVQGILMDDAGSPFAYRFRWRDPSGMETRKDIRVQAASGRKQLIHVADGDVDRPRGITPLAPVLTTLRQYDQLADATLTTTLLQTIFAATIYTPITGEDAFEGLGSDQGSSQLEGYVAEKLKWWKNTSIDLGSHGRINHLFPGEKLEMHRAEHPHDNYQSFSRGLLREVARCMGVTYESLTGDFDGASYSSIQMGTAAAWKVTQRRRKFIPTPMIAGIYAAWLEEEVASGRQEFEGGIEVFQRNRAAATTADWRGPAKPVADDLKAAKAINARLEAGVTSLTYETAELGLDAEDIRNERARESREHIAAGLPDPHARKEAVAPAPAPDPDDEDDEDDKKGDDE